MRKLRLVGCFACALLTFGIAQAAVAASCSGVVDALNPTLKGLCLVSEDCSANSGRAMPDKGDCTGVLICCGLPKDASGATPAGGASTPKSLEELDPLGKITLYQVVQNVIRAFLGFVGALALLVFIYAGITWMTAGSSDRIQKAKDSMKYAVIGLALIVFAYAITTFFLKTLAGG